MQPPALQWLACGRYQIGEVNKTLISPWSSPSLERCTWSLSEQSTVCLPAAFHLAVLMEPYPCFVTVRCDLATFAGCVSPKHREGLCGLKERAENHLPNCYRAIAVLASTLLCKLAARIWLVSSWLCLQELLLEQYVCCSPVLCWHHESMQGIIRNQAS